MEETCECESSYNKHFTILWYVDDVLLADTQDYLQRLIHTFNIIIKQYNMAMSTEYMLISKEPQQYNLEIQGKFITGDELKIFRWRKFQRLQYKQQSMKETKWFLHDVARGNKYMIVSCKVL